MDYYLFVIFVDPQNDQNLRLAWFVKSITWLRTHDNDKGDEWYLFDI